MSGLQILGALLVASPLIATFIVCWRVEGARFASLVVGGSLGATAVVVLGAHMLTGQLP